MAVLTLIFRRGVSNRIRLQAMMNAFCAMYLITMTIMVTHIAFFYIVPECYQHDTLMILKHRLGIWYVFTAVVGNYLTCIFTETRPQPEVKTSYDIKAEEDENRCQELLVNRYLLKRKIRGKSNKQDQSRMKKSENYCKICDINQDLRTHHCNLCEKCVMKRDHHCFFMGVCIGKSNHLYFILFTLFMGIGTFYGLLLLAKYLHFLYGVRFHGPQTFLSLFFNTIMTLLKGKIPSMRYMLLFMLLYVSLVGTLAAFGFLFWHVLIVARGQTSYEVSRGITKYSKASYLANILEVFNKHSVVSLFFPFWDLAIDTIRRR